MTTLVQITGCIEEDGEVVPFVSNEDAGFYGVYLCLPGEFQWQADFLHYDEAYVYASAMVKANGFELDDKTYNQGNFNDTKH